MADKTIIVLRAADACEIKLDFLTRCYAELQALSQKLEERLEPRLRREQKILWTLNYFLADDQEWMECFPFPSVGCEICIVGKNGRRSEPFKLIHPGKGPMIFDGSADPVFDYDRIVEAAAQSLLP